MPSEPAHILVVGLGGHEVGGGLQTLEEVVHVVQEGALEDGQPVGAGHVADEEQDEDLVAHLHGAGLDVHDEIAGFVAGPDGQGGGAQGGLAAVLGLDEGLDRTRRRLSERYSPSITNL